MAANRRSSAARTGVDANRARVQAARDGRVGHLPIPDSRAGGRPSRIRAGDAAAAHPAPDAASWTRVGTAAAAAGAHAERRWLAAHEAANGDGDGGADDGECP